MKRKSSNIVVNVLDFSLMSNELLQQFKDIGKGNIDVASVRPALNYGYVETDRGIFVINSLGQGVEFPVDNLTSVVSVPFYTFLSGTEEEFIPTPVSALVFKQKEILDMPILRQITLDKFIHNYGVPIYNNYIFWEKLLNNVKDNSPFLTEEQYTQNEENDIQEYSNQEVENTYEENDYQNDNPIPTSNIPDNILMIKTKVELKKYSPFLICEVCNCSEKIPLIKVTKNICTCGNKTIHVHCKKCGGILD